MALMITGLLALSSQSWALEPEIQAAKDEGMRLYGLGIAAESIPLLEPAAEAGDVDAMYYLGEIHRLRHMGLTQAAMGWYLQAAEQNDVYAMLRLFQGGACIAGDVCPEEHKGWREAALAIAQPQAEASDPDAMLALFHTYRMFDEMGQASEWLERAAEAGQPEAQTLLGNQILDGRGWYLTNGRRLSAAEEWFRKAAEQGYVPGMSGLARVLNEQKSYSSSWEWLLRAAEAGHADRFLSVGWCYFDPDIEERCPAERDVVRGWAMLSILAEKTNNSLLDSFMRENENSLTIEQLQEAKNLVESWQQELPLSNFPPRFGY
ncbi:tetratricopeptide repeat protein [Halomonas kalidii]|uniref:Tetratricopeptide repeat protein n=1 Tax=Halomonas kalidii TaxID=3043293 RepID=A0ABT6VMS4_9GAMM|nr:tetratricopeptide repeat protein [Halomonas kalidii]MDI5935272.1 tetratricopeptide repeat protein [Halomonas kalidii]